LKVNNDHRFIAYCSYIYSVIYCFKILIRNKNY